MSTINTIDKDTRVLLIGGSAGSLSAVLKLLPHLTRKLNLVVVMIFHRKETDDTTLIDILSHRSEFGVKDVEDKEVMEKHMIYVAPPDYHLLIEKDLSLSLDISEKVNFSRPSIDVTFESGADALGSRVIGLLLSGANADGVTGLQKIHHMGGKVVVQNPAEADVPYMPQQAVARVKFDLLLSEKDVDVFISMLA